MNKLLFFVVGITLLLSACGPVTPIPSATPTVTPTLEPTDTPLPTNTPVLDFGSTVSPKDGMTMLYVPAGEFGMGVDTSVGDNPVHRVYLDAYWMDKTEVTNDMFALFVENTDYVTDAEKKGGSYVCQSGGCNSVVDGADWKHPLGPYSSLTGMGKHPVVHVSWNDANAYCAWADRRLPTETEWEKGASWDPTANEKYGFPWGNDFDCLKGNFDDETLVDSYVVPGGVNCDGFPRTSPVGTFLAGASPYGILDMAGNVLEWVMDWYDPSYYSHSPYQNPDGPNDGRGRVMRGGSWYFYVPYDHSSYRYSVNPFTTIDLGGFRCARSQ